MLRKKSFESLLWYSTAVVLAIIFLVPLYFTFINALNGLASTPVLTLPKKLHPENFVEAIIRIPFWRYLKSSVIIVSISVFFAVWINFILGYAFARMNAPGKDIWFSILISLMMVPAFATSIPTYVLFSKMQITDSYLIWILNGIGGSPFYTFLFRQFMQTIPKELEEAARIDGSTTVGIMFRIILPLTIPVVAVVFMFEFLNSWGDFVQPFMFLNEERWPLSTALMGVRYTLPNNASVVLVPLQLAASLLFMIPSVIVYFAGQKYIKEGMITSGLKG
ncbi:carbohydrate ABC transporter permease [Paenibacillus prosopidis]|uniref:Multiple sugar transport system permease protein n=1 Tax=Paenibacillus prosopidis TaxID=630520 RepID=A0A368W1F2_9BACL|nr:carbohydrate ABC transporter permease [Paenibacillus prosopidis]RCW47516.1 multiple sugar transport system permease protein [Paenibacillus prosopidis]